MGWIRRHDALGRRTGTGVRIDQMDFGGSGYGTGRMLDGQVF